MRYLYPFTLEPDETGELIVEFPDVPGALTSGADAAEAEALAEDCLIAALGGIVQLRKPIPEPSSARGRPTVVLPPLVAGSGRPSRGDSSRAGLFGIFARMRWGLGAP